MRSLQIGSGVGWAKLMHNNGTVLTVNETVLIEPQGTDTGTGVIVVHNFSTLVVPDIQIGVNGPGVLEIDNDGTVMVANHVELGDGGRITLGGGTLQVNTLTGTGNAALEFQSGTLDADGDVTLSQPLIVGAGGTLNIATRLDARLTSLPGSTINIDGGPAEVNIGVSSNFLGVNLQGSLYVNDKSVRLNSAGFAQLGTYTLINGGAMSADKGIALGTGDNLVFGNGGGTVSSKVVAAVGSLIRAQGAVTIGDAAALDGFVSDGVLEIGTANMTLLDANQAVLGSLTDLGLIFFPLFITTPGTLQADNGLILEFGKNLTGYGTVNTANDSLRPTIINGYVAGYDSSFRLTFTGYVKGVGTFTDVVMNGTYAPGLSTAEVNVGNLSIGNTGTLEIEIGGLTPGSAFDQINSTGIVDLDGTLDVLLLGGFTPSAGDTFEIITAASVIDTFATETLPALAGGLEWFVNYSDTSVELISTFAGDFDFDGDVDGTDFLKWQRGESLDPLSASDLAAWEANYGAVASPITAASTSVPEPSTCVVLLIGIMTMLFRRDVVVS